MTDEQYKAIVRKLCMHEHLTMNESIEVIQALSITHAMTEEECDLVVTRIFVRAEEETGVTISETLNQLQQEARDLAKRQLN